VVRFKVVFLFGSFFPSVEAASSIGKWQDGDNFEIAVLKLTESEKLFYQRYPERRTPVATYTLRQRYKDVHTDQYYYLMLQTAIEGKNEVPHQFVDRYRSLSQKITWKVKEQ